MRKTYRYPAHAAEVLEGRLLLSSSAVPYSLEDLGTLGGSSSVALGLNNSGTVVGYSETVGGEQHAFRTDASGRMIDLGGLGARDSFARAINDAGEVVGESSRPFHINVQGDVSFFGPSAGSAQSINEGGDMAGWAQFEWNQSYAFRTDSTGQVVNLGTLGGTGQWASAAFDINNSGQAVGYSRVTGGSANSSHAFRTDADGKLVDIGTLGGIECQAYGINNPGQIVGFSDLPNGARHAFVYASGVMHDLGVGETSSVAYGVNDVGDVVGVSGGRGVIWTDSDGDGVADATGTQELQRLLPPDAKWTITVATSINCVGQIAVGATGPTGQTHALLLTPDIALREIIAKDYVYHDRVAGKPVFAGYSVDAVFQDDSVGFYALGLKATDPDLDPILAVRGTETDQLSDWFADFDTRGVGFKQFLAAKEKNSTKDNLSAEDWLENMAAEGQPADVIGHSLGGAVAQWLAADVTARGRRINDVVTFNSPGISHAVPSEGDQEVGSDSFRPELAGQVTHYITNGDVVSMVGEAFIDGDYILASFNSPNRLNPKKLVLDKHMRPVEAEVTRNDHKVPGTTLSEPRPIAELNSPWFMYRDIDYFVGLATAQIATAATGSSGLAAIPAALLFRQTAEEKRRQIAEGLEKLVDVMDTRKEATRVQVHLPDVELRLLGLLDVQTTGLSLRYQDVPTPSFRIQGRLTLPDIYDATADFAGANYIEVRPDGWHAVGSLSISNVEIPGGWGIKSAVLFFDTEDHAVSGKATVTVPPGFDVTADLAFLDGHLDAAGIEFQKLNVPLGNTGAYLQSVSGRVDHLAQGGESVAFTGGFGVTAGPEVTVKVPEWLPGDSTFTGTLARLDVQGTISSEQLSGKAMLHVIESPVGSVATGDAEATFNWAERAFSATGDFKVLGGFIGIHGTLKANAGYFELGGAATASTPRDVAWLPDFLEGRSLASANGLLKFSPGDGNPGNDTAAAWGSFFGVPLGGFQISLWDGTVSRLNSAEINALTTESVAAMMAVSAAANPAASAAFQVPPSTRWLVLHTEWDSPVEDVAIEVAGPDGTVYQHPDFGGSPQVRAVPELSGSTGRTVAVADPAAGTWTLRIVDSTALGQVRFDALRDVLAPGVVLMGPTADSVAAPFATVPYSVSDPGEAARVTFYYDTDTQGYDGVRIGDEEVGPDGSGQFLWDTTGVAAGTYHLYAVTSARDSAPAFSAYSPGRVVVNASVAGRYVSYNNSFFDAGGSGPADAEGAAIATDKQGLGAAQASSFANYTSYSRGITGVLIDVTGLANTLTATDFVFATGLGTDSTPWAPLPADQRPTVSVRWDAGALSNRVALIWPHDAIRNAWLQVTVKANERTGLPRPEVFYFGNLVGETGDRGSPMRVTAADILAIRRNYSAGPVPITNRYDINRDGRVNAFDAAAARANVGRSLRPIAVTPAILPIAPASSTFSIRPVNPLAKTTTLRVWAEPTVGVL
jgi:probable HAF family extracellular repeat protein